MQNRLISDCFESHFLLSFVFIFIYNECKIRKIYLSIASLRQIKKYDCFPIQLIFLGDFSLKLFLNVVGRSTLQLMSNDEGRDRDVSARVLALPHSLLYNSTLREKSRPCRSPRDGLTQRRSSAC